MDIPAQIAPARAARTRRVRPLRTLLFILGILVILLIVGFVIVRAQYLQPIDALIYPDAALSGTYAQSGTDHSVYYSTDTWKQVAGFYVNKLGVFDVNNPTSPAQGCKGVGDREVAHCIIDHVTLGYEQIENITISTIVDPQKINHVEIVIDRVWPTG